MTQTAKYETGATSHAVNDLILFTENNQELTIFMDKIYYKTANYGHSLPDGITDLLWKAVRLYERIFPNSQDHLHITDMNYMERNEYCKFYIKNFRNWKKENDY